jgi:hypothetical protein
MRQIEQPLVVRIRVDSRHHAADDAEVVLQTLATGARQFVVQEAIEITWWPAAS